MGTKKIKNEHQEQVLFVTLVRQLHPDIILYAIPNGGYRHIKEAVKLKNEGVTKGVPDICIAEPRTPWHGLYIEMKRTQGGIVSEDQKNMISKLESKGYKAIVAYGATDAYNHLLEYLSISNVT